MQIDIATATGKSRAWIYAFWVCEGYNPYDSVFWGIYDKGNGPGDKAWGLISPSIIKTLGSTIDIPDDILT